MVKIELDIKGISWYIETTLETDTVPAVGDIIIVDKMCIRDRSQPCELLHPQAHIRVLPAGEEEERHRPGVGSLRLGG